MRVDEKTPLQPSKTGGSKPLSVTVRDHPVLGLRDGLERVSRTAAVTANQFDKSDGQALANALKKIRTSVDQRVGDRERAGTFYYITYEAVIAGDDGPGRPVRPPVDGEAAGVVLDGMSEAVAA